VDMAYHITKDYRIFTLNKGSSITIHFLFDTSSQTGFVLHLIDLESLIIVLSNTILVVPEVSNERSVLTILSLEFPDSVHFLHCLVTNSQLYIFTWTFEFISEWLYEVPHTLSFIINSGLFKVVNDPLEIIRWDLNVGIL